jgi:HK97 family phage portal protein
MLTIKPLFTKYLKRNRKNYIKPLNLQGSNITVVGVTTAGSMQWYQISNMVAWTYYMRVSVVYNAIDIISEAFAVIPPRIWDKVEQRYLGDDDTKVKAMGLLELLQEPSFGTSYNEFAREVIPNYIVTGDLYTRVKAANETSEPSELDVVNSKDVSPEQDDKEGKPIRYTASFPGGGVVFDKDPQSGRFYNKLKNQEIWHTKVFNPTTKIKGFSPLNPLFYEIEQFIASSIHNGNLLKQGARPSGVLTIDKEHDLDVKQYERIREHVDNFYKGAGNTGNILILQGGKEFKQLSLTNKDMDFSELKKTTVEQIYRNLKIPMSLILSDSMTLDNFKMAVPVLYKMAVFPIADIIFQELNKFLMHRYDDPERYELTYNKKDITALEAEFNAEIDRLITTGLLTTNEGRELLDRPPLVGDVGNQIFKPANLLPIGVIEQAKGMTKEKYSDLLRKNNFSEEQIKEYIEKYYKEAKND